MAAGIVKAGALIRASLPGRKQPRIYSVTKVARGVATLRLAWAEAGKEFPVLGVAKEFRISELRGIEAYSPEGE